MGFAISVHQVLLGRNVAVSSLVTPMAVAFSSCGDSLFLLVMFVDPSSQAAIIHILYELKLARCRLHVVASKILGERGKSREGQSP
jgi:hypothetical protein